MDMGADFLVIKQEEKGGIAVSQDSRVVPPALKLPNICSTIGAGDAFGNQLHPRIEDVLLKGRTRENFKYGL